MLHGATTFSEIAAGSPGISRTTLATRLRELQRAGVVEATPNPSGRGSRYHLTEAGKDLGNVMAALGTWGERWVELTPEHVDAGMALWAWANRFLALNSSRGVESSSSSTSGGSRSGTPVIG